jgi:hypothetical protein
VPYSHEPYDDWEGDTDDDDFDNDFDDDLHTHSDDEEEPTVPCPYCRAEIHEDAERCPSCGQYISEEDRPPRRQPRWVLVTAVLCLLLIYLWIAAR